MRGSISITKKLFFITTLIFAIFVSGTLVTQSLFFEQFYINRKKSELTDNINNFKKEYNSATEENQDKIIEQYEVTKNLKIGIVSLDSMEFIHIIENQYRGKINDVRVSMLEQLAWQWIQKSSDKAYFMNKNVSVTSVSNQRTINTKVLFNITPNPDKNEIIFAVNSLQPVNEASEVIKDFYIYFYIGAAFLTLVMSLIYSNMIAKPLVKINKVATKMAKLNFEEKCYINSTDEIGNVGASLNFLSENLNNALTTLKEANFKLEEDIEKERNLEKMRKEFIAAVSHELKTPISLIDGYAVGLKDNIFEGEDKEYYLDIIIDESRKMSSLVTDMLDLSQLESGTFKLKKEEFNIDELIHFTLKKYSSMVEEKQIKLEEKLIPETKVYADWNRMEQVITNFMTNALKHVEEGGNINFYMINSVENICISIENSGPKISEEDIDKIWDQFYKADKSRNRKLGGTGIGLSIVKNILLTHEYSYGAVNTDMGVKFYFTVPKLE